MDELLIVGVTGALGLLGLEGFVPVPTLILSALFELFFRSGGVFVLWAANPAPGMAEGARGGLLLPPSTFWSSPGPTALTMPFSDCGRDVFGVRVDDWWRDWDVS